MSTASSALARARSDAQQLHQRIDAATSKNTAAARVDLQDAAAKAKELAASLKTTADAQRADAKQHLKNAATELDAAATHARALAAASQAQIKDTNLAMLANVRDAVQHISRSIAANRPKMVKA